MADDPTDPTACTECGHRNIRHVAGDEPCLLPGCPCPVVLKVKRA